MSKKRKFVEKSKIINIPIKAIFDEETNEPICSRWVGEDRLICNFLLFRKFGQQAVCGYCENIDLFETTTRGFIKPKIDCIIHNG